MPGDPLTTAKLLQARLPNWVIKRLSWAYKDSAWRAVLQTGGTSKITFADFAHTSWGCRLMSSSGAHCCTQTPDHDGRGIVSTRNAIHLRLASSRQLRSGTQEPFFSHIGSLNLFPGKAKEANWLPAPKASFIAMIRMYWPKETPPLIIDGTLDPPAVKQL